MANDLAQAQENLAQLISSPVLRGLRKISLGTVQWPGQASRRYLSGGSTLTPTERQAAERLKAQLTAATIAAPTPQNGMDRLGLITKMLMAYPIAGASAESGRARGEAYQVALDDVPPAIVNEAIRRWNRGEAGENDYRWAPAPAVLRQVCMSVMKPLIEALQDIDQLLAAVTLERAMDPAPLDGEKGIVPQLRRIG